MLVYVFYVFLQMKKCKLLLLAKEQTFEKCAISKFATFALFSCCHSEGSDRAICIAHKPPLLSLYIQFLGSNWLDGPFSFNFVSLSLLIPKFFATFAAQIGEPVTVAAPNRAYLLMCKNKLSVEDVSGVHFY